MPVTNYYTVDGEIIGESTGGVEINYATDALGSVVSTLVGDTLQNTYASPCGRGLAEDREWSPLRALSEARRPQDTGVMDAWL